MNALKNASICLCVCIAGNLMVGCAEPPAQKALIGYYLRSDKSVLTLNRLVFVALDGRRCPPRIADNMTSALLGAIQDRRLFHIDVIQPTDPVCRDLPFDSTQAYSLEQFMKIREELQCDAVLFGSVTHFQTYPRMQIGIYVRLLDLKDGKLLWAVDHIWDTTDAQTEQRIKRFFADEMRSGYDPLQWRLAMMSPKAFQKFVAYEATETLPVRPSVLAKPANDDELEWEDIRITPRKLKKGAVKALKLAAAPAKMIADARRRRKTSADTRDIRNGPSRSDGR